MTKLGNKFADMANENKKQAKAAKSSTSDKLAAASVMESQSNQDTTKSVTAYSWVFATAENAPIASRDNAVSLRAALDTIRSGYNSLLSILSESALVNVLDASAMVEHQPEFKTQSGETIASAKLMAKRVPKLMAISLEHLNGGLRMVKSIDGAITYFDTVPHALDIRKMYAKIVGGIKSAELLRGDIEKAEKLAALQEKATVLAAELDMTVDKVIGAFANGIDEDKLRSLKALEII